ncbi:hypothetical protein HPP92_022221 [Vanilla planifolia]|uniref:Uncharacterized protein n=1 Tax=Vanilla planifolia TaxID=51239 RepID=A0A835PXT9_VANPL|nr:hypothetical protein HPP92_022221 [Vanilla planifolia]
MEKRQANAPKLHIRNAENKLRFIHEGDQGKPTSRTDGSEQVKARRRRRAQQYLVQKQRRRSPLHFPNWKPSVRHTWPQLLWLKQGPLNLWLCDSQVLFSSDTPGRPSGLAAVHVVVPEERKRSSRRSTTESILFLSNSI